MSNPKRHLLVCTNRRPDESGKPSCAARGSEALLSDLKRLVKEAGLGGEVWVTKSGCLKHCSRGPAVICWPENILLGGVSGDDLPEITERCGRNGETIERLKMADIVWE